MFSAINDFFGNPYSRGQFEYHGTRKRQQLKLAALCAVCVAALVITGYLIYHTRKNLLMVPGLLMVLPFANFFVTWLALADGRELSPEQRAFLKPYEDSGMALYHLMYCDEKGKRQYLDAVVVYQGAIVAYARKTKPETKTAFETDCITRMKKKNVTLRLRIYTDWQEFQNRLAEVQPEVPQEDVPKVEKALATLVTFCL